MKEKISEEEQLIWNAIDDQSKQFERIDKNTAILFIISIITLIIAIVK